MVIGHLSMIRTCLVMCPFAVSVTLLMLNRAHVFDEYMDRMLWILLYRMLTVFIC